MTKTFSFIITLLFLGLGFILGILNPEWVPVDFYWYQIELPISLIIVIAFAFGLVSAGFILLSKILKLKWQLKRYEKAEKKQLNEIMALKKNLLEVQKKSSHAALSSDLAVIPLEQQK